MRDRLGLKPLLACLSYPPEQVTERGVANISNLISLGFDVVLSAPAPGTWKRLMRASFDRFTNWARSTELALFSSVPQLAIRYGIPLILWGENPGLQLGDLKTLGRTGYDGNNLRYMNTLSGGGLDWMLEAGADPRELIAYRYPSPEAFEAHGLQIVYLGWFLGDWSLVNNGMYAATSGLHVRTDTVENTGDLAGVTSLDEDWVTLNQMIKYYKFGFGRVTDYVNEEIRLGRLTREGFLRNMLVPLESPHHRPILAALTARLDEAVQAVLGGPVVASCSLPLEGPSGEIRELSLFWATRGGAVLGVQSVKR